VKTWGAFYRKWNGVVHDFIHQYIYMDLIELAHFSKFTAMMMSFVISAILHEYIVTVVMGFFLPILFVLFGGPGILFIGLTRRKTARIWNVFMWIMLSIGTAMLMVIYSREYFARFYREPPTEASVYDYVVPYTLRLLYRDNMAHSGPHPEL
jgi:sterol O-acyltransferase